MNFLCKYKDIFGRPNEGVHSYRLFHLAAVDVILTVLFAWWIHIKFRQSFWVVLLVLFLMGIVFHRLFCVKTVIDRFLFGNK
jgi:hypothetical protein